MVKRYELLDLWMALGGDPIVFEQWMAEPRRTEEDAWAQLLGAVSGYGGPVSAAVCVFFNPPDDDASFESIMVDAIARAAEFIEEQPCTCDAPDGDVCDRCVVLGRFADVELER